MNVAETLRHASGSPSTVTVEGVLQLADDQACIVDQGEVDGATNRLVIHDGRLCDRLLDSVPCLVGGRYLYCDSASVTGVLSVQDDGIVFLKSITSVEVVRDGNRYSVD